MYRSESNYQATSRACY